jgi:aminobenzoyl-glutamate utilization protein A
MSGSPADHRNALPPAIADGPLDESLVRVRRDFHRFAERGWMEVRTAGRIIRTLEALGWDVEYGRAVIDADARMGVPPDDTLASELQRALDQGADPDLAAELQGGFTGVVATLRGRHPRPLIAVRFDIDANNGDESSAADHRPFADGFASANEGAHHNCGHDGHTAIGLGLARVLAERRDTLPVDVRLIFQPAEEGVRGAAAMVAAGVVKDVDVFLGCHIGFQAQRVGHVIAGYRNLLASTKFDVEFTGRTAHAAMAPHEGRNGLLAAATAVQGLYAISRHGDGETHVNVGYVTGGEPRGEARNAIPARATLRGEVRGSTNAVADYMFRRARQVIEHAAGMHDVEFSLDVVGRSPAANSDQALAAIVSTAAAEIPGIDEVSQSADFHASDDVTAMMVAIQAQGGHAAYVGIGSRLDSGHHTPRFDFDERALRIAVDLLASTIDLIPAESAARLARPGAPGSARG